MKRVEITEEPYIKYKGQKYFKGDIITHEEGQLFQDLGWAKDPDTEETGERIEGVSRIKPDNITQVNS